MYPLYYAGGLSFNCKFIKIPQPSAGDCQNRGDLSSARLNGTAAMETYLRTIPWPVEHLDSTWRRGPVIPKKVGIPDREMAIGSWQQWLISYSMAPLHLEWISWHSQTRTCLYPTTECRNGQDAAIFQTPPPMLHHCHRQAAPTSPRFATSLLDEQIG